MKRLKKAGICVLAAAVVCGAAAGLFACNDEQAPKELAYVYGAAETVTPFWMNTYGDETVVYNEVVTPILHPFSDTAVGYLAYEPTRVISVRDYTLGIEYDADDYTVEGRKISVDPDGGMPYLRDFWLDGRSIPEELSDGVSPTLAAYSDGGGLNGGSHVVSEGSLTRTRHLAVTYAFDHTEQALGFEPQAYTPENFARFTAKLEAGEPVRILVLGDSIFVGMSASSMVGFEPQLPPFFDLIKNELAARFYGGDADMIELVNVSMGGETSDYGVQLVEGGETDLAGFDFVMIGFGMNDGTLNVAPAAFTDNIERMIDGIRLHSPDADFAVLGCFIPNPSSVFFGIQSSYIEPVRTLTAQKNGEASGCTYVGMYDISAAILGNKQQGETVFDDRYIYIDISGNYTNHPNDFMVRLYAGSVLAAFLPFGNAVHTV